MQYVKVVQPKVEEPAVLNSKKKAKIYKNILKFLESKKIDMDKAYPKLVLRENKIFSNNKFLIYVKSPSHIVIGSKKLNVKTKDLFSSG